MKAKRDGLGTPLRLEVLPLVVGLERGARPARKVVGTLSPYSKPLTCRDFTGRSRPKRHRGRTCLGNSKPLTTADQSLDKVPRQRSLSTQKIQRAAQRIASRGKTRVGSDDLRADGLLTGESVSELLQKSKDSDDTSKLDSDRNESCTVAKNQKGLWSLLSEKRSTMSPPSRNCCRAIAGNSCSAF